MLSASQRTLLITTALILAAVLGSACADDPDQGRPTTPNTSVVTGDSEQGATITVSAPTSSPPDVPAGPVSYPDDWLDIVLSASAMVARPGDSVDVTITCPHRTARGLSQAPFEAVYGDLTLAMEELDATARDLFTTSFVVPYWVGPGSIELRGACPHPPGPCDDTADCKEYATDPTPVVILPIELEDGREWFSWRPVTEPYLDLAEVPAAGEVLPGGARVIDAGSDGSGVPWAVIEVEVGDRLPVAVRCPAGSATDGARFVIAQGRLLASVESADPWGWAVTPVPDDPDRYVLSSEDLLLKQQYFSEPLPLFGEVAAKSVTPADGATVAHGEITFESWMLDPSSGDETGLLLVAVCEDVGMPFDPRSIDLPTYRRLLELHLR